MVQDAEAALAKEHEWGRLLQTLLTGLLGARRFIVDEAARKLGLLLAAPAITAGHNIPQAQRQPCRAPK